MTSAGALAAPDRRMASPPGLLPRMLPRMVACMLLQRRWGGDDGEHFEDSRELHPRTKSYYIMVGPTPGPTQRSRNQPDVNYPRLKPGACTCRDQAVPSGVLSMACASQVPAHPYRVRIRRPVDCLGGAAPLVGASTRHRLTDPTKRWTETPIAGPSLSSPAHLAVSTGDARGFLRVIALSSATGR